MSAVPQRAAPAALVLGPVQLPGPDGGPVAVPGVLARRLIAVLALAGTEGRSAAALADDLWADEPPRNPRAALQMLVSRVRAGSAPDLVLSTAAGYRLTASDLARIEAVGLTGAPEAVAAAASAALDAWRGVPGDDLEDEELGAELAARALRARVRLLTARAEALLTTGDAEAAAADAATLGALLPLDPAPVALRMRALDAAGRTAEALAAFAGHRERLAEELGADPDPALAALHTALLRRDDRRQPRLVGVRRSADELLGREPDLVALTDAVTAGRLVTVLGPGGVGKTRLAHELAARAAPRFGRVVFVELAGTRSDEDVLVAVGGAVGARTAQPGRRALEIAPPDLRSRTVEALAAVPTLLLLDNCEHVVDAAALLADDLLAAVDDLVVVTTSRVALRLPGEVVHALPTLDADTDASTLFVRRARAARADVRLDPAAVHRVVAHLDGLPLAIELAAARLRAMSLEELEAGLADRFALLVGGSRAAPERHRTLFEVIDWSARLLPEPTRRALADLAVFPDGFTAEGAALLLGGPAGPVLEQLVEQSLLRFREAADAQPRYRMLETVREFGLATLQREGRAGQAAAALDAAVLTLCRRWAPRLIGGADPVVRRAVLVEEETLRTLLVPPVAGREEAVLAVFGLLGEHSVYRGEFEAVLDRLPLALAAAGRRPASAAARDDAVRALVLVASFSALSGGAGAARALVLLRRVLDDGGGDPVWSALGRMLLTATGPDDAIGEVLAATGDPALTALAALLDSQVAENAGRLDDAIAHVLRAREASARQGYEWFRLFADSTLTQLRSQRGDREAALELGRAVERDFVAFDPRADVQQVSWLIALNEIATGELDDAEVRLEALAHPSSTGIDAEDLRAMALAGLADLAAARGDEEGAAERWAAAVAGAERSTTPWTALVRAGALTAAVRRGDRSTAAAHYRRLRSLVLALLRLRGVRLDRPVVAAAALALAGALLEEPATAELGAELGRTALAAGARLDLPALAGVRARIPEGGPVPGDPADRLGELLRLPAARRIG